MANHQPNDLDLLTGAVAVSEGFIDFDAFRRALQARQSGEAASLADALQAQGSLAPEARTQLELTTTDAISQAGGDVLQALVRRGVASQPRVFTVGKLLGKGGAGEVFEALEVQLGRSVALKFLTSRSPRGRARFENEVKIGALLDHPNVCPVYTTGTDPQGRPFIAMKRVEGRSLAQIIQGLRSEDPEVFSEYTVPRRVDLVIQAAQGIAHAHARGVIHRDIKPDNIMAGRHGEVFVMDWGLAKVVGASSDPALRGTDLALTADGDLIGTPLYMPPEQLHGNHQQVDHRADLYALGATLFELLTLEHPIEGDSVQQILARVTTEPPRRFAQLAPGLPAELERICRRCLEKQPDARYPSVDALLADLRAFREGQTQRRSVALVLAVGFVAALIGALLTLPFRPAAAEGPAAPPPPDEAPTPVAEAPAQPSVSVDLGGEDQERGLFNVQAEDGHTVPVELGGQEARTNRSVESDSYFYFAIHDGFAFQGNRPRVAITLTYFDRGKGVLNLEIDAGSGGAYKLVGGAKLGGTESWIEHTFRVDDAEFANGQGSGADFRIYGGEGRAFFIDRVRVAPRR